MSNKKKIEVALVYDFDGTLSPGNMQEFGFVQAIGKEAKDFWTKSKNLAVKNDASEILCYMSLMIKEAKYNNIRLTQESFRSFGSKIELFPGVLNWFKIINKYGYELGLNIKHYINSSGLKEMIEGTAIAKEFENIYACSFLYDINDVAYWPSYSTTTERFMSTIPREKHNPTCIYWVISLSVLTNCRMSWSSRALTMKRLNASST